MGYVGLALALLFTAERLRVTGFDIASDKVEKLDAGGSCTVRIPPASIEPAQHAGFSPERPPFQVIASRLSQPHRVS